MKSTDMIEERSEMTGTQNNEQDFSAVLAPSHHFYWIVILIKTFVSSILAAWPVTSDQHLRNKDPNKLPSKQWIFIAEGVLSAMAIHPLVTCYVFQTSSEPTTKSQTSSPSTWAKWLQVQLHIFSMLEGDSGNKPGFKMLKEAGSPLLGGWMGRNLIYYSKYFYFFQ